MPSELVVTGVRDALAVGLEILESAKEEVVWLVPPSLLSLSISYGFAEKTIPFIQNGGVSRGIVQISHANIKDVEICVESGEDVRHSHDGRELWMVVGDGRQSVSATNIGIDDFTLDTPATAFWSDSPTYAQYLLDSFEHAWSQAVPAAERMQELSEQGTEQR
jgi:hypothetical protein